jgi:hypothetical protein
VIAVMVAQATGTQIDQVAPMTTRPPVRPIDLTALAALNDTGQAPDNLDKTGEVSP